MSRLIIVSYGCHVILLRIAVLLCLSLFSITSFANIPEIVGTWSSNSCPTTDNSGTNAMTIVGNYAYVGAESGFRILNISNPSNPSYVGGIDYPGDIVMGVAVAGNYAYLACYVAGLKKIDITNPAAPVEEDSYAATGVRGVAVNGSYVYLTASPSSLDSVLLIFDSSSLFIPLGISDVTAEVELGKISLSGNYAYVTEVKNCQYVYVFDITDPGTPFLASQIDVGGVCPQSVITQGSYSFIANTNGLDIVNIANLTQVALAGRVITNKTATDLAIQGKCAYLVGSGGIQSIDITNVANPTLCRSASCRPGEYYNGIAVKESYAYAGWNYNCSYAGEGTQQNGGVDVIRVIEPPQNIVRIDPTHLSIFTMQDPRLEIKQMNGGGCV